MAIWIKILELQPPLTYDAAAENGVDVVETGVG